MFTFERIIRLWLPTVIFVVCVVLVIVRHDAAGLEAAGLLAGGGGGVVLVNEIQRIGFAGDVDRHKESEAREFLERYGMWPGQASPELIAQARSEGMLEHVVLPPRPGAVSGPGRA